MKQMLGVTAIAAALGMLPGLKAQAAVLTFEELPHAEELQGVGDLVESRSYTLRYSPAPGEPFPVGFHSVGSTWRFNERSTALTANSCSALTRLTARDDKPFSLVSMDLAELNGDAGVVVTFIGQTVDGKTVRKIVQLDSQRTWQTVWFPASFQRLHSVEWLQGDCLTNPPHMFDNVQAYAWRGRQAL